MKNSHSRLSGSMDHLRSVCGGQCTGGGERGRVRRIAQQRLADALAEDAGLAARGSQDGPGALGAVRAAHPGREAARPAVQRQAPPGRRLERHARQAAHALARRRARATMLTPSDGAGQLLAAGRQRLRRASPAASPASRRAAGATARDEVSWRTVERRDRRELGPAGRAGRTPRRRVRATACERSHARSTTWARRRSSSARRSASSRSDPRGVQQDRLRERGRRRRRRAVGVRGSHATVGRSVATSGSTIVSR